MSLGQYHIAKILIGKGANVNAINKNHATPLMLAAENGKEDLSTLFSRFRSHVLLSHNIRFVSHSFFQ